MAAKTVENKVEEDKCIFSTYPSKLLAKNMGCENCNGYKQNCFAYIPKSVYTKQDQSMAESLQK